MRTTKERRGAVLVLGVAALLSSAFFYGGTLSRLTASYDPNAVLHSLEKQGALRTLDAWEVTLETCVQSASDAAARVAECEPAPGEPLRLRSLPAVDRLREWKARTAPGATHAVFRYLPQLGEGKVPWEFAALVVPRSVHNSLTLGMGAASAISHGVGNDTVLHVARNAVDLDSLRLRMDVRGLPWFGPADFPVAIVEAARAPEFLSLTQRSLFAGDLQSLLEVGVPVLFGAVALVLDHSPVFAGMALYGSARAARAWVAAQIASGTWGEGVLPLVAYALANAACIAMLVGVGMWIAGARARVARIIAIAFGSLALIGFGLLRADSDALLAFDLRADALAAVTTALVLAAGIAVHLRARRPKAGLAAGALLLVGTVFHAWVNVEDIRRLALGAARTPLDWRHSVLFPFLAVSTLVEVGSVGRSMRAFAAKAARTALLEKEVDLARDMQRRILPVLRRRGAIWSWRVLFKPIVALGGDWVDVRRIDAPRADGLCAPESGVPDSADNLLVAAVVDVTGHGIGPALVTGTLCAQWGLWCASVAEERATGTFDGPRALERLSRSLDAALVALGRGDTCTGLFIVHDPRSRVVHFITCGHPGFLVQSLESGDFAYVSAPGSWIGNPGGAPRHEPPSYPARTLALAPGAHLLALYTDGIVPPGASLTGWLKELRRDNKASKNPAALARALVGRVRANRRRYLSGHAEADDITLALIHVL